MSIRDDFFANKAVGALWDVAVSIKRGNPLPLDSNSVFASYADLEAYATAKILAYPGQIVAVVNADSTGIYYLDQDLAIQEVGKIPSADNKSIEVTNDVISMYNFGKYYYKYISEVKNEETGEIITAAKYEKTKVSDTNIWAAGLEPKVVSEDGELVIGWFEPNPTTAEGVQDQVVAVQGTVEDLEETLNGEGGLVDQVEDLQEEIGTAADEAGNSATGLYALLDTKADKETTYTKTETNALIAAAEHLKRKIFESIEKAQEFVNANSDIADQYIYMIPTGLQYDSNRYYEYMIIDGALEPIGQWEVDMADYFTEDELKTYLENYYNSTQVDTILTAYAKSSDLEGYYKAEQVDTLLEKYYTQEQLDVLLEKYVLAEEGKSLVSDTEIIKLGTIKANAEENFIKSVEQTQFTVSEVGQLSLTPVITNSLLTESDKAKLNALVIEDNKVEISGTVNAANVQDLDSWIVQTIASNRDTTDGLLSTEQENKLIEVEKNFINSVDEEVFSVTQDRQLLLKSVPAGTVEGLLELTETVQNLDVILNGTNNENNPTEGLVSKINSLNDTYVSIINFNTVVGDLNTLLTNETTLVNRIDDLDQRLKWQEMTE